MQGLHYHVFRIYEMAVDHEIGQHKVSKMLISKTLLIISIKGNKKRIRVAQQQDD